MRKIFVIAHDMRSAHNVGSLFRTCEGLGVKKLFLTGYTPYPIRKNDTRLPHLSEKLTDAIEKTSLGAIYTLDWEYVENISEVLDKLEKAGTTIVALEQTASAQQLPSYATPKKIAMVLGTEVTGLPAEVLKRITSHIFIPMFGKKESFNVVQAAAMAIYQFRFH